MKLLCALGIVALAANAAPPPSWTLIQNSDFQIYSQAGDNADVRASLLWFEQLRAFFAAAGLPVRAPAPVRVIGFRSVKDYDSYRLRPTADAYYVGTGSRDYIVMPALGPDKFNVAAHEYAHVVLHAALDNGGLHLPSWLNEGMAEFFSTVRIGNSRCELGGGMRNHLQILNSVTWLPLPRLLETSTAALENRQESSLFYAQAWALTEMLLVSPEYRFRFPELIAAIASGQASAAALTEVYGKSLAAIDSDVHARIGEGKLPFVTAPGFTIGSIKGVTTVLTPFAARSLLAELLLASGELDRAKGLYDELAHESPHNADVSAALGTVALRKGDLAGARLKWKQAIDEGIADASLCYRYAVTADDAGVPLNEIRPALERAIELRPDFDDARFKLALLESNASNYAWALSQLKAMQNVAPAQRFVYWLTLAFAQDQLGQHDDSKVSAQTALRFAKSEHERAQAAQLIYIAGTELTVQFTRDANGNPQMSTARVSRGAQSWNPFVEPQDLIRRAAGQLRTVECGNEKITGVTVDTGNAALSLAIPDPLHVLIRGATEFTCGPQDARAVTVEYAASPNGTHGQGILRGMEVLPQNQTQ